MSSLYYQFDFLLYPSINIKLNIVYMFLTFNYVVKVSISIDHRIVITMIIIKQNFIFFFKLNGNIF
jgi:hypothetical protein